MISLQHISNYQKGIYLKQQSPVCLKNNLTFNI